MFTTILLPNSRKVSKVEPDGITEYVLRARLNESGIWVFNERGFYAEPLRQAEQHEKEDLFNKLDLPQVGVLPVLKTSRWFCLPLNENQYRRYVKVNAPLPLFFAPEISVFDPLLVRIYKHRRTFLIYEDINERYPLEQIDRMRSTFKDATTIKSKGMPDSIKMPKELLKALNLAIESEVPPLERLVKEYLRVAQAEFKSLSDQGSGRYRVTYGYGGREDSVVIDENLFVVDAGICLSGRDREQNLSSIVFVKHNRDDYRGDYWDD